MTWDETTSKNRIRREYARVEDVDIKEYARDTNLASIPVNVGYRVDGVHLYIDITNFDDILTPTGEETETKHKRALRFLDLHQRAVYRILDKEDVVKVDFHNQRLHAVVTKPYGDAEGRVNKAVAVAQLIIDVLGQTGDTDDQIPNATARVGIDTGLALAVANGRWGDGREPLFLGNPANLAAKHANYSKTTGIFLTEAAREIIGLETEVDTYKVKLKKDEIEACQEKADLETSADEIVAAWKKDLQTHRLSSYQTFRPTPPLSGLDYDSLTPSRTARIEATSVYADLDGFTHYVADRIENDESAKDIVRTLHVVRAEMTAVLKEDFKGKRIRYIGDCLHGVLAEGSRSTDTEETITSMALCAGGLRSGFEAALDILADEDVDTGSLGLAIGFDLGPVSMVMLGLNGQRLRCCLGQAVIEAEAGQANCNGTETKIGKAAYDAGTDAVRSLFGKSRRTSHLDYPTAVLELTSGGDESAEKAARSSMSAPAIAAAKASGEAYFR